MQPKKLRILSAITAGSLALAVAAITASSGTSHAATRAVLTVQTESFPPVNLDNCPVLQAGYPTGGCVAQLQTDLKVVQDPTLVMDGTFGPQTYNAVTAFQGAHGLPQDGMVGPATKNALKAALSGSSVSTPTPIPSPAANGTSSGGGTPIGDPIDYVCGLPGAAWILSMCSQRTHSWMQVRVAHCIVGHGPYWGLTGPGKFAYWAGKCEDGEYQNW